MGKLAHTALPCRCRRLSRDHGFCHPREPNPAPTSPTGTAGRVPAWKPAPVLTPRAPCSPAASVRPKPWAGQRVHHGHVAPAPFLRPHAVTRGSPVGTRTPAPTLPHLPHWPSGASQLPHSRTTERVSPRLFPQTLTPPSNQRTSLAKIRHGPGGSGPCSRTNMNGPGKATPGERGEGRR